MVYKCDTLTALPLKNNGGHIQLPVVREDVDTVVLFTRDVVDID